MRVSTCYAIGAAFLAASILLLAGTHGNPFLRRQPERSSVELADRLLNVERPTRNLDLVPAGSLVHERFVLVNRSDEDVSLQILDKSCSCIGASLSTSQLSPGREATLDVRVDTAGVTGGMEATVDVFASPVSSVERESMRQANAQTARLRITMNRIDQGLGLHPNVLEFTSVRRDAPSSSRPFSVTVAAPIISARIERPFNDILGVKLQLNAGFEGMTVLTGDVTLDPGSAPAVPDFAERAVIEVVTAHGNQYFQMIAGVSFAADVIAVPRVLYWKQGEIGNRVILSLSLPDHIPVSIASISCGMPELLDIEVLPPRGHAGEVSLSLARDRSGVARTELAVHLTDANGKSHFISLPVLVL